MASARVTSVDVAKAAGVSQSTVSLVLSGLVTNLLALGSRAVTMAFGVAPGGRPFDSWWLQAMLTYPLSGVIAGLVGALLWFQFNERDARRPHA